MSSRTIDVKEFHDFLGVCRQRFVMHSLVRGLSSVVLTAVGAILCAGLFDFLIPLPGSLRLVLLIGILALSALSFWTDLLRPLMRGMSDTELGAAADLACPDLDEALATLASVEAPGVSAAEAGSAIMRQRLWQQLRPRLATASRTPLMESGPTARRCGAAASIILVTLVPFFVWQSGSLLLLQRLLLPFRNHATATDLYFQVEAPGDVAARGDNILFQARPMWRSGADREPPSAATLQLKSESGHTDSLSMKYDEDNHCFTATLREVSNSLEWQIIAGRTATEVRTLRVVDRPQLIDALLTVIPPEYTGLPPQQWPGITGTIDALQGSQVTLNLTSRAPIVSAELIWTDNSTDQLNLEAEAPNEPSKTVESAIPFELHEDPTSASMSFPAEHGGSFRLRLIDRDNITNRDEQHRHLRVRLDEPPTLNVRGVRGRETMRPDAIVPVSVQAQDDVGLASLELHIQAGNEDEQIIPAAELSPGDREFNFDFRPDLSQLNLSDGDEVRIRVRATDGYVPAPHEVWSDPIQIQVDSNADAVGADAMKRSTQQLVEQLETVRQELRQDTRTINELGRQAAESWTQSSQAITLRLSEQEQQHGRKLEELAQQASRHPLMESPAADLGALASVLRRDVAGDLINADTSDSAVATQALDQAKQSLTTARAELDRIIDQIEQAGELEQDLAELNRLALEAEQLANDAAQQRQQAHPDNEATSSESKRIESQRRNLTAELTKLLADQDRLREAAQEAIRNRLNDAAELAAELASRQQQISDGVTKQAEEQGDSIAPDPDEPHAGAKNLLNRIEELAEASEQMSQAVPSQAPTDAAEQLRTSAALAAELSRTGQFNQSAGMLRQAAEAAVQHQQQAGDEMPQDLATQSSRLQNQLRQAASLVADLERNDSAQRAVQRAAQADIAAATQSLASELSQVQEQVRMPVLELNQEASSVSAAEQSSMKAQENSVNASEQLPTGQLRAASENGAQAAAALRRVAEVAQQSPARESERETAVPTEVGQSVTDALQNLNNAAQPPSPSSTSNSPPGSNEGTTLGSSESEDSQRTPGDSDAEGKSGADPTSEPDDGAPVDDSESGDQPGEGGQGTSADDERARQLANAAAALSNAARQSLPSLNENDAAMDSAGLQAGAGVSPNDGPHFAADMASPTQPAVDQRNWRKLNDELSSEILSGDREHGDARYGSLIRAYFRQLARQSVTTSPTTSP